jgi:hypothetical protein
MATFTPSGQEWDVAVGGVPFMLATSQELPQSVETIPIRKEQFDTETDPGEQSLTGWWRRSQASFHGGAGYKYEPTASTDEFTGFWDSSGVDVWNPGEIKLLRKMEAFGSSYVFRLKIGSSYITGVKDFGFSTIDTSSTTEIWSAGPADAVADVVTKGDTWYAVTMGGQLATSESMTPTTSPDKIFDLDLPSGFATFGAYVAWAMHRLWVTVDNQIWQPDLSLATGSIQPAIYTNPDKSWVYTDIAEGPAGVYFAGNDGRTSSIQMITLDSDGALPTLSGATVVATLPPGELCRTIEILAGQYIGIGTTHGFRVGLLRENGSITYGPLIIRQDPDHTLSYWGCSAITAIDRFFLVAIGETAVNPRIYKVDTGTGAENLAFPYARDAELNTATGGQFTSLAVRDNDIYGVSTDSDGTNTRCWKQSSSTLVDSGWIQTSRIRFRTTERKAWKYLNIGGPALSGTITVEAVPEIGSNVTLGSYTTQGQPPDATLAMSSLAASRYLSVKFTLSRTGTQNPKLNSYLVRAMPSITPQRMYTLPLLCFDRETAKSGQRYGADGYAHERLAALQALEDSQATVTYQDFSRNPSDPGVDTLIESIRFVQTSPSTPPSGDHTGGVVILQLRTLEA